MRKLIISCLFLFSLPLLGQEDSLVEFDMAPNYKRLSRPFLDGFTEQGGASANWTSQQIYQFFYGDFIDDALKEELMANASNGLQLSSMANWEFRFCYEGHQKSKLMPFPTKSFYIFNRSYTTLSMSYDLTRLMLYGNRSTASSPQDIGAFNYQSWFFSGLGHQYTFLIDTIPLSVGVGLVAMHTLDRHNTGTASLTTASDGSQIDFNGAYDFGQSGATSSYGISGWGLAFNLATAEKRGNHELKLFANDLGFAYMPDWLQVSRDSSFSFSGLDAGSLFTFDRATFDGMIDSLTDGLVGGSREGTFQLLPFQLGLDYRYNLEEAFVYVNFDYRNLPNYLARVAGGYGYNWENLRLQGGLAYGGFNGFSMDLALNWKINRDWHLRGGMTNVFGLAIPTWSGGTLGSLGLRYIL